MKFTEYFDSMRTRPDRTAIQISWIERVMAEPLREEVQADGRVRLWGVVPEMENRVLRVVLLEDRETVHNAFFDRGFKP